jgi:hypothetical protein
MDARLCRARPVGPEGARRAGSLCLARASDSDRPSPFCSKGKKSGSLSAPALVFQSPKAAICSTADLRLVLLLAATGAS